MRGNTKKEKNGRNYIFPREYAFPPRGEKEECEGVYISICEQF